MPIPRPERPVKSPVTEQAASAAKMEEVRVEDVDFQTLVGLAPYTLGPSDTLVEKKDSYVLTTYNPTSKEIETITFIKENLAYLSRRPRTILAPVGTFTPTKRD
jgi:hypothetical protein